jgi:hypothetical protein
MERTKLAKKQPIKLAMKRNVKSSKQSSREGEQRQEDFENGFESMLAMLTPDQIWQVGYRILAKRQVFERLEFAREFVGNLQKNGINIFTFFILLGIDAADVGELTPADFGMLLRYFRLNHKTAYDLSVSTLMNYPDIVRSVMLQLNKNGQ